MIIAVFPNALKEDSLILTATTVQFLSANGAIPTMDDALAPQFGVRPLSSVQPQDISFRLSLGGDGTILRIFHQYPAINAPLLGVNLGSLGFLANVPREHLISSLKLLLDGNYVIEQRMVLSAVLGDTTLHAINEFVVHRGASPSLVPLELSIDGDYLNTFSADGVIIATPTGSTAYSLAAGGPIVSPEIRACLLTPICPHTISNRPVVLLPKQHITVRSLAASNPPDVIYDGLSGDKLHPHQNLVISIGNNTFPLVLLKGSNHFATLRQKLGWHGRPPAMEGYSGCATPP